MTISYWKIRIDTNSQSEITSFVKKYTRSYIWSFEKIGTDDQHAHFYIETEQKEATIRSWIRKHFGKGNGIYSMTNTEKLPLQYCAYLIKERRYDHNLSEEFVKECIEYDDKVKSSIKERKSSRRTILDQMIEELESQVTIHEGDRGDSHLYKGEFFDRETIVAFVVDFYKTHFKRVNPNQLATECHTLCLRYVYRYHRDVEAKILHIMDI